MTCSILRKMMMIGGVLALATTLGFQPAIADDDHRGKRQQCNIVSAFIYQSTEFENPVPVIDVYGSGFSTRGKRPKVKLAGVPVGDSIEIWTDNRVVLAFDPNSAEAQAIFDEIPGPTPEMGAGFPGAVHLKVEIKPRGRNKDACAPITLVSGLKTGGGPVGASSLPSCDKDNLLLTFGFCVLEAEISVLSAFEIANPSETSANLLAEAPDFFWFTALAGGGEIQINTVGTTDTLCQLFDGAGFEAGGTISLGKELASNDDGGEEFNCKIVHQLVGGQNYVIKVRGFTLQTTGDYTLHVGPVVAE